MAGFYTPDEVLLRRFGLVRAVGGLTYFVAVAVLLVLEGARMWPLVIGVPVLAVVYTAYFTRSAQRPRLLVSLSLLADCVVLGGLVVVLGGTSGGAIMLYSIVVVSAGILMGPPAARLFTAITVVLAFLQLGAEQLGLEPLTLHREALGDRMILLSVAVAGLISVGYLSATYASRLHELIAEADTAAVAERHRSTRRRTLVRAATVDVRAPLDELDAVAAELESSATLSEHDRHRLAGRLRMGVSTLDAEVAVLADVGALDEATATRPVPVSMARAVEDCVSALAPRLEPYILDVEVPENLKVLGEPRAVRRIVWNLIDNVITHTPQGTQARVHGRIAANHGVLVVSDDGPGVPAEAGDLFAIGSEGADAARVGLPLVRELCVALGADIRHDRSPEGGARFTVAFRLAPSGAPTPD